MPTLRRSSTSRCASATSSSEYVAPTSGFTAPDSQSATISAKSGGNSSSSTNVSQSLTRTNYFVDVSLTAIPFFKLIGEIGQASGGTVNTFNSFEGGRADRSMTYVSLGATFKW